MSVTSGFFNSLNGDRKYNAEQLSAIFDGIITEGVFEHFADCFKVTISDSRIIIGRGRAWLNSKWILNDSELIIDLPAPDNVLPRYDAIILDMNSDADTRANTIKLVSASPAAQPSKPVMLKEETHKQYPICYIRRNIGQTTVTASDVEIMIGKDELPYITAPLKSISVQEHFNKWDDEFNTWFQNLKDILDDNTATALYNEIAELKNRVSIAELNISSNTDAVKAVDDKLANKPVDEYGYRIIAAFPTDITAGSTPLTTGQIYAYYE